ncbi:MAG: hypothetical protein IJZ72_04295 [Oscillospiraceae bacterium]|nr:hypothetical protein [Oscillospiraceae bacterium]
MTALFLKIAGMSITACAVIGAVLLLRLLLKKAPRVFSYVLWAAVFFRLLCPFSLELPSAGITPVKIETVETPVYEYNAPYVPDIADQRGGTVTLYTSDSEEAPVYKKVGSAVDIFTVIWLCGTIVTLSYGIVSYIKLKKRLRNAAKKDGYFLCSNIDNPFIMGVFKPEIFLPEKLGEKETAFILMHENAHIRRGDHIAKIIMFSALCLHWFNPLVWLSFRLCEKDMEMSCDEKVTKDMSPESKADYGQTLLNLTAKRTAAFTACFGENGTKQRVKNVLSYKKPALWIVIICTILAAAVIIGLSVNQKEEIADSVFGSINASPYGDLVIEINGTEVHYNADKDKNTVCNEFIDAILNADIKQHGRSILQTTDKSVDFNLYMLDCFTVSSGKNVSGEDAFEISCVNIKIMDKKFFEVSKEDFDIIYSAAEKMVYYDKGNLTDSAGAFDFVSDESLNRIEGNYSTDSGFVLYNAENKAKLLLAMENLDCRFIKTSSPLPVEPFGELRFYFGEGNAEQDYNYYTAIAPFKYEDENSRVIYGLNNLSTDSYHYYEIPYITYSKIFSIMYNAAFDLSDSDRYERLIDSDNWVVHKDGDIISGSQVWSDFYASVLDGKSSSVNIAHYYTLEGQGNISEELYTEIKDDYPKLFKSKLEFDGNSFTLTTDENVKSYRYLKRYDITPESPSATYSSCTKYILINEDGLTWNEINRSMLSSQSNDYIDHYTVYNDYTPKLIMTTMPPRIKINGMEIETKAYSLTEFHSDGTATAQNADSSHPLYRSYLAPLITLSDTKDILEIECDYPPQKAVLTEWDITEDGNFEAAGISYEIDSPQMAGVYENKIYQLRLYWENSDVYSGHADYVFRTGTAYPIIPVSKEWSDSVYFGSEFPRIIYADEKICAFTEGVSGFFIYSFEEEKLVFTAEMKETLLNADISHGGLDSWNGISFAACNADGELRFLCSAHTPDSTRGFDIDLSTGFLKEIDGFEMKDVSIVNTLSSERPDSVTSAFSSEVSYFDNGYVYIANSGINNRILPGEGSHLPMIKLVKVNNGTEESFLPFAE